MMWRFFRSFSLVCLFFTSGCGEKRNTLFSYRQPGYYYRLLSFQNDTVSYRPQQVAWVSAVFKTQSDSVFWDSFNNLRDRFFIRMDSGDATHFVKHEVSRAAVSDSICLLIRPSDFFRQQFGRDTLPFFCAGDSVVKVLLKLKQIFDAAGFERLRFNLEQEEASEIEHFFGSAKKPVSARDPLGFYWIDRPRPSTLPEIEEGDQLSLSYRGYFLNGRIFESPSGSFEYTYGTPDQLLKGLNYVTGKLKLGQTAKILLPSRLAFGENGSSNGIVPPFSPLIYELKIIDVKKRQ